jgi:hypothetical protein
MPYVFLSVKLFQGNGKEIQEKEERNPRKKE